MNNYKGFLIINKKKGTGSTDYVRIVRKLLNQKKVGHSGTLDLMARGVLVICLGKGTKMIEYLQKNKKTYIATIKFGEQTDTLDTEGKVINKSDKKVIEEDVLKILPDFVGDITQIPPMYSALKINGKRLYNLAREGIIVERKSRNVNIYSLDILNFNEKSQECTIKTTVSAGTYIRTLIDDIGLRLDNYAHMTDLIRTKCSGFSLDETINIESETEESIIDKIVTLEDGLKGFEKIRVEENTAIKLRNGMTCKLKKNENLIENQEYLVYSNKDLIGLGIIFKTLKGTMLKLEKHLY